MRRGDLLANDSGEAMATAFTDLLLNVCIVLMLPALLSSAALDTLTAPSATRRAGPSESAHTRPALVLSYVPGAGGALEPDSNSHDQMAGLEALGPDDTVVVVLPREASYGAAATVLRALAERTDATLQHVETKP